MKTKTAYLIRNGEMIGGANVSNKLRSYSGSRRALRACKRMGHSNAYAAKILVNADCQLKN